MNSYFIAEGGQQRGPFPVDQLAAQRVGPDTPLWADGMAGWLPARSVPEVTAALGPMWSAGAAPLAAPMYPPQPQPQPGYAPPGYAQQGVPVQYAKHPAIQEAASTKMAAGLCGILIGGLGIHRFLLGDTGGGILRIVLSVATCGLGGIIGLIEGIIYLTKSDEEFYQQYIVEKKAWF